MPHLLTSEEKGKVIELLIEKKVSKLFQTFLKAEFKQAFEEAFTRFADEANAAAEMESA